MGPFSVVNTNGDGGIREFFQHAGEAWTRLSADLCKDLELDPEVLDRIARSVDATWRRIPRAAQRAWRDDMVHRIRALKQAYPVSPPELDD
jgi:hypothetical protein